MIRFLFFSILLFAPFARDAFAYNPLIFTPERPYAVKTLDFAITDRTDYLGALVGDPHTFEFAIGVKSQLVVGLSQVADDEPLPLSLIVVRENDEGRGVTEIGRMSAATIKWEEKRDPVLGLTLYHAPLFTNDINPGIYRIEVSAPENAGKYMLTIGTTTTDRGYITTLGDIRTTQKFFGATPFRMLLSSYVYYPLGIIILSGLLYRTWRARRRIIGHHA